MPAPPPPPPPPPMPGMAGGGPPPPPPPPPGGLPSRPPANQAKGRGALLGDIEKGARLRKVTQVNDRSAPIIAPTTNSNAGSSTTGAPPIPGGLRPPAAAAASRARSNSDLAQNASSGMDSAPQLGGLFAGGMPKLRKSGGVNTGAYDSDPEPASRSVSQPSLPQAPSRPNGISRPPGAPPLPPGTAPSLPAIGALKANLRPTPPSTSSSPDVMLSKPRAPPPIGKKPPLPPPTARKPSNAAPPPPPAPAASPVSAAPPPPGLAPRPPPTNRSSAPAPPSIPVAPPPPPVVNREPSLAAQAVMNSFRGSSPLSAPPAPPSAAPSLPPSRPSSAALQAPPPPPPPTNRSTPNIATTSMADVASYTLTNGVLGGRNRGNSAAASLDRPSTAGSRIMISDSRFRFQGDDQLPKPREPARGPKRYRAGRGSTVPLDLSSLE